MSITVITGGPIVSQLARKPILEIIQEACAEPGMGVRVPTTVFGSTQREHVELKATALKMATAIAFDDAYDWSALKTPGTLTGDGTQTEWLFPNDYRRMLKKAQLWRDDTGGSLRHVTDTDRWLGGTRSGSGAGGDWTIIGDRIVVRPAIPSGSTVSFYYISSLYAYDSNGVLRPSFAADSDTFRLDAGLLRLAIVWRWKAAKGQPYAEDLADYETAKASLIGADRGSVTLTDRDRHSAWADVAYPYPLG